MLAQPKNRGTLLGVVTANALEHARAVVNQPSIILADEPTGNLDSRTGEEIMALFGRLYESGNTIVIVTHEEEIAEHARRVVRLRDGVVESDELRC